MVDVADAEAEGEADEVAFVEFIWSSGIITASRTCIRPLCVLVVLAGFVGLARLDLWGLLG